MMMILLLLHFSLAFRFRFGWLCSDVIFVAVVVASHFSPQIINAATIISTLWMDQTIFAIHFAAICAESAILVLMFWKLLFWDSFCCYDLHDVLITNYLDLSDSFWSNRELFFFTFNAFMNVGKVHVGPEIVFTIEILYKIFDLCISSALN